MKRICFCLLIMQGVCAMEEVSVDVNRTRPTTQEIAGKIADLIKQYGEETAENNDQFKALIIQYFATESITIENNILPHLKEKLRQSDSEINDILGQDDRVKLESFINRVVTESLEAAFHEKDLKYEELKAIADNRLQRARYALITAIVTGVCGALGIFFGVYFGR